MLINQTSYCNLFLQGENVLVVVTKTCTSRVWETFCKGNILGIVGQSLSGANIQPPLAVCTPVSIAGCKSTDLHTHIT
jgi:hypothetical protein